MRALLITVMVLGCSGAEHPPGPAAEPTLVAPEPVAGERPVNAAEIEEPADPEEGVGEQVGAEPASTCVRDDECEMYTYCCACPRTPAAVHVDQAARQRSQCRRVRCAACGIASPDDDTRIARCIDGGCVAVEGS